MKEVGRFFFHYQGSEPMQGSHTAQQIGDVLETIEVHRGFALIGKNGTIEPPS